VGDLRAGQAGTQAEERGASGPEITIVCRALKVYPPSGKGCRRARGAR